MNSSANKETITISYDVCNGQDEVIRTGRISGSFAEGMSWIDMVDELTERAYAREAKKPGWRESYSVTETR